MFPLCAAACPEWAEAKGQSITAEKRDAAPLHVFSELTQAEYRAGVRCGQAVFPGEKQGLGRLDLFSTSTRSPALPHIVFLQPSCFLPFFCGALLPAAVLDYLFAQKSLGLTDITKAQISEKSVSMNYVHGIWYEVRLLCVCVCAGGGGAGSLCCAVCREAHSCQHNKGAEQCVQRLCLGVVHLVCWLHIV